VTTVERICRHCDGKFRVKPAIVRRGGGKYCSRRCAGTSGAAAREYRCQQCGDRFRRRPTRARPGKAIQFCSNQCKFASQQNRRTLVCTNCGDKQQVKASDSRLQNRKYRCPSCRVPAQTGSVGLCPGCFREFPRKRRQQVYCQPACRGNPIKMRAMKLQTNHARKFFGIGKKQLSSADKKRLAHIRIAGRLIRGSVSGREAKQILWLIEKGATHAAYITRNNRAGKYILWNVSRKGDRLRGRYSDRSSIQADGSCGRGSSPTETDSGCHEGTLIPGRQGSQQEAVAC